MKFRELPVLKRKSGMMLWPPQWSNVYQPQEVWPQGEIGTLEKVWMDELLDRCVFLHMRNNVFRYVGAVNLDNRDSCLMIYNFLKSVVGRSIAEIGDLGVSHCFELAMKQTMPSKRELECRSKGNASQWHFCSNCPDWPLGDCNVVMFQELPLEWNLCANCVALYDATKCECSYDYFLPAT
jgi:hypothetical protein